MTRVEVAIGGGGSPLQEHKDPRAGEITQNLNGTASCNTLFDDEQNTVRWNV